MPATFLSPEEVADLGMRLRAAGYGVGTDQCIAAQRLMVTLAASVNENDFSDRTRLTSWLAPIFCANPTEQADFSTHYVEWLRSKGEEIPSKSGAQDEGPAQAEGKPQGQVSRLRRAMAASAVALAVAGSAVLLYQIGHELRYRTVRVRVVDQQNAPVLKASLTFRGTQVQPDADGKFTIGFRLLELPAKIEAKKDGYPDTITLDSHDYQQEQTLRIGPTSAPAELPPVINPQDRLLLTSAEADFLKKALLVEGQAKPSTAPPQPSTWERIYSRHYRDLSIFFTSLPLLLTGLWLLWKHLPRLQLIRWKSQHNIRLDTLRVSGSGTEFFNSPGFRRIAQQLRRHRLTESTDLDPERTVLASAGRGGWFTPVYLWRQRLPDYLILIDRAGFRDVQGKLIDDFVRNLRMGRVEIDCYDFYSDPRTCYLRPDVDVMATRKRRNAIASAAGGNGASPAGVITDDDDGADPNARRFVLDDLLAKHPNHILLIFSDASGFFSSVSGKLQPWVERYAQWTFRALFVPEAMINAQGDRRARILQDTGFLTLPATEKGLSRAVDILDSGQGVHVVGAWKAEPTAPYPSLLLGDEMRWMSDLAPAPALISLLIGQLRNYLGPEGFDWLCACTVYPELSWDLTLYLGNQLRILGPDERRLSSLLRLPWFRLGSMPDWLRQHLADSLPVEEREEVRAALWRLLETALEHPLHDFKLRYAAEGADKPGDKLKSRWRRGLLKNFLHTEPPGSALRDYVFISVMQGRKPGMGLRVPDKIRELFGRVGHPNRPIIQVAIGTVASVVVGTVMYMHPPQTPVISPDVPQPLPAPTGRPPYHLSLQNDLALTSNNANALVFLATGDTGGVNNPVPQQRVADALTAEYIESGATSSPPAIFRTIAATSRSKPSSPPTTSASSKSPSTSVRPGTGASTASPAHLRPDFLYLLGDLVYFDGAAANYSSQFYNPYQNYPRPIFAIPGNHDGTPAEGQPSLEAFVRNFCAPKAVVTPEAGSVGRTAMTEPNPYWTLDAPFATIIGLYTNVPNEGYVDKAQEAWLEGELRNAPSNKALIIAMHHPVYSMSNPGGSDVLAGVLDRAMLAAGRAPDLVLSAHVNNYQRFSRTLAGGRTIPYIVVGTGGYPKLTKLPSNISTPFQKSPDVTLESYSDTSHGVLRLTVSSSILTTEYLTVNESGGGGDRQLTALDRVTVALNQPAAPKAQLQLLHTKNASSGWDIRALASGDRIVREQVSVNGVNEYDQSFNPPTTYNQIQLAQQGKDSGPQTVRMVVTNDRGQDAETTDTWTAAGSSPNAVTHLAGTIVPPPANWASMIVVAVGKPGYSPVDSFGKFDLPVKGSAGDKVRIQILSNKRPVYDAEQILPGPITIRFVAVAESPIQRGTRFSGRVVTSNGQPVSSVQLSIGDMGVTTTDSDGRFQVYSSQHKMGDLVQIGVDGWEVVDARNTCVSSPAQMRLPAFTAELTITVARAGSSGLMPCPTQGSQNQPTQNPPLQNQQAQNQAVQNQAVQNQPPQNQAAQTGPQQTAPNAPANRSVTSVPALSLRTVFSPDRNFVAEVDSSEQLVIRDARSQTVLFSPGRISSSSVLAWSPDGKHMAWTFDTVIMIWDAASRNISAKLSGHSAQVRAIAWSPPGGFLASAGDDKAIRIWDVATGREIQSSIARSSIRSIEWGSDGNNIVCTFDDGTTSVWNLTPRSSVPAPPSGISVQVK